MKHISSGTSRGPCTRRTATPGHRRPGVALVTRGPGVTDAVTGIATAYMDSIPWCHHGTGADAGHRRGCLPGMRHGRDHASLREAQLPREDVNELAITIKKAFHIATTGRPGAGLVDIPKDVSQQSAALPLPEKVHLRSYAPVAKGTAARSRSDAAPVKRQAALSTWWRGPSVRRGVARGHRAGAAPRFPLHQTTLMGLGSFPASDRRFVACSGCTAPSKQHGQAECDVLLAVGAIRRRGYRQPPAHFAAGSASTQDRPTSTVDRPSRSPSACASTCRSWGT